jgi:transposase
VILAELPAVDRLPSARSAAAYCGRSPREFTSGTSVRKKTRLSKAGNPRLREALFLPARTTARFNPPSRGSSIASSRPGSRRCRRSGRGCGSW